MACKAMGLVYRFVCQGCGLKGRSTLPRAGVPYIWRCKTEGCGWTMQIQGDSSGFAAGWTRPKVTLRLVKPAPSNLEADGA